MFYIITANTIVCLHLGFVCFVVLGGLLGLKWRRLIFLHLPAAVWGALIEYQGWLCPLTPLEQHLRQAGNQAGYSGGFIEHYLLALLYPDYLDREMQIVLGTFVVVVNLAVYGWIIWRGTRKAEPSDRETP
jgi:hypothetical protein